MRRALLALLLLLVLTVAGGLLLGNVLTAPVRHSVGPAPADLQAIDVEFGDIRGWFTSAGPYAPCVLLMHGVRSDRRSLIERARLLRRAGYSSLLFDFQAHGESAGTRITLGQRESANAHAALAVMHSRFHCSRVAAIGQSLGGAAALLGEKPIEVDALILESVYPTIEAAIANRLRIRLGELGARLAPLLTWQLRPLLGIDSSALQPVQRIRAYQHPLFIISGSTDRHTTLAETRALYAAANQPKQLWIVPDAAHVDLQRFTPADYARNVLGFLAKYVPVVPTDEPRDLH
jgi:fermentation-respiration switch protein FrsA (DUF1100 family)